MFAFPLIHPRELVEAHDLARDLHLNIRRVETRYASNPTLSFQDSLGERSIPHAIRAHRPHPRDHHTSLHSPTSDLNRAQELYNLGTENQKLKTDFLSPGRRHAGYRTASQALGCRRVEHVLVSYQEFNTRCKTGNAWDLASCLANRLPTRIRLGEKSQPI